MSLLLIPFQVALVAPSLPVGQASEVRPGADPRMLTTLLDRKVKATLPLSLDDCIEEAIRFDRRQRRQQLQREISTESLARAELAWQPSFSSIADLHVDPVAAVTDTSSYDITNDLYRVGIGASYDIFDSGVRQAHIKISRLSLLDTSNSLLLSDQLLKLSVVRAFVTLVGAQRTKSLGASYTAAAQGLYDQVKGRLENGLAAEPELRTAEAELARAKSTEIQNDLAVQQSSRDLAESMGREWSDSTIQVQDQVPDLTSAHIPDDIVKKYQESSYTVEAAMVGVESAKQSLREVRASYGAHVTGSGSVGFGSFLEFPSGHYAARPYIFLGVNLSIPFFVGPQRRIDEKIGKDQIELRQIDLEEAKRTVAFQALSTQGSYQAAVAGITSLKVSVTAAEAALRLAKERYANGLGADLDVILALRQLYSATDALDTAINQEFQAIEESKVSTSGPKIQLTEK